MLVVLIIAVGGNSHGRRELLGMDIGFSEPKPFGAPYCASSPGAACTASSGVTSDAHEGLKAVTTKVLRAPDSAADISAGS